MPRTASLPGSNSESIRRDNLSAVLREVHISGPRSRSEIVSLTGLNRSTVAGIVAELSELGLVHEEPGGRQGAPGRPSPWIHPRPDGAVVLAIGIAVHTLDVAVVGLGGHVHEHERVRLTHSRPSLEEALAGMRDIGLRLLDASGLRDRIVGVGVAAQGAVRSEDGFVHFAPNLGWSTVPLARLVEEWLALDVPVVVRNEADLGARAEHLRGAGAGFEDVLFLSCDVGVGGGVITGGRPLTGASGYAGEVGHVPINPEGSLCGCGSRGCWETEVGQRALLRRAGRDPDAGPEAVAEVLREAESGDAGAIDALIDVGRWLGLGLAGLINVFDPKIVVLGGLFAQMAPFTLPIVRHQLEDRKLAITREPVEVVVSALGADAPVLGAAERAFEPLLADPAGNRAIARRGPLLVQTGAAM
jgi:predicted NBD/HSP70 family sugar kinase